MSKPLRVLIVEDIEDHAELLVNVLKRGGYSPTYERVDTSTAMNAALDKEQWDIIIADYSLPCFSADAALKILQEKGLDLPFIIVSGNIGEETAVSAMKAGAHDYLMKGKLARLVPAIERELREAEVRRERRRAEQTLRYLAFYDILTALPNRAGFLTRLNLQIERVRREQDYLFAVLFLDIDRFQIVKYSLGHLLAEQLLVAMARRIKTCLGPRDILARVGTNEFAILLANIKNLGKARKTAQAIHQAMQLPFSLNGSVVLSNTNIGIVLSTIDYGQPEDFLRAADTAMHYAKLQGAGCSAIFDTNMQSRALARLQMETDLQQAIKCQELHLNYQPIVSLSTSQLAGFEALLRWRHPRRGQVAPDDFIPIAEETGLIIPLGQWVLEEACRQLKVWQNQWAKDWSLTMSINLSGIQLSTPNLIDQIDQLLAMVELEGDCLKLEITETMLMENASSATAVLKQLQQRQIQVCIDDFGKGYSSLSYLHQLPINTLKIDRSFINCIEMGGKNSEIVRAIVTLAHNLGLDVVAEGVETLQQCQELQTLGCEYGQGYFFSRPLDNEAVINLMGSLTKPLVDSKWQ